MKEKIYYGVVFFICILTSCFGLDIKFDGVTYDDDTVSQLVTVITVTSPIPSLPSTKHLYAAQASLYRIPSLALCKKIIVFDGFNPQSEHDPIQYEKYKKNVIRLTQSNPYFFNTKLIFCRSWEHLSGSIAKALKRVKTPFVYMHQHDLILRRNFNLNGIIATMVANPKIKYVHFSGNANNTRLWQWDADETIEGKHFVPLTRFFGWSDQCHVATVDYYKNFVLPQCDHTFMEKVLHFNFRAEYNVLGKESHRKYASYLYGNLSDGYYCRHTDGSDNYQPRLVKNPRTRRAP